MMNPNSPYFSEVSTPGTLLFCTKSLAEDPGPGPGTCSSNLYFFETAAKSWTYLGGMVTVMVG